MSTTVSTASRRTTKASSSSATSGSKSVWNTARCHRLIRPLTSKLRALESITQTLPSIAAAIEPTKESKVDPAELPYKPSTEGAKPGVARKRNDRPVATDRDLFFGRTAVRRTYSGMRAGGAGGNGGNRSQQTSHSTGTSNSAAPQEAPISGAPVKGLKSVSKDTEGLAPQQLLNGMQSFVHPSVFSIYSGICSALETLLVSTAPPESEQNGPRSLTTLAARKVAHCILATSADLDSDDVWYDHSSQIGASGEYLREIVRWHGIELIREAIRFNFIGTQRNGLGLASVLVGLCKQNGATAEAESLLQSMFELRPLSTNSNDSAFATLVMFWKDTPDALFRIIGENMVSEGTPVAFGNPTINAMLKDALADIEYHEPSRKLVTKAFESAFAIWGEEHITTARMRRREQNRRKGPRSSSQRSDEFYTGKPAKPFPPLPANIGNRAETMALDMAESLVLLSLDPANTAASEILENLVQGFTLQSPNARTASEEAWETSYPIAAKVLILAQSVSRVNDPELHDGIVRALSRSLSDIRDASGKEGLQSVGEYIARCYLRAYNAETGKPHTEKNELKLLVSRLLSAASSDNQRPTLPSASSLSAATPRRPGPTPVAFTPTTPFVENTTLITFTPASVKPNSSYSSSTSANPSSSSSIEQQADRYYISRLALNIALEFATLQNHPVWTSWVQKIEHRVLGLKLRTPAPPPKPQPPSFSGSFAPSTSDSSNNKTEEEKKKRKGWRWEEGISEWVAVGYTPGKPLQQKPKRSRPTTVDSERSSSPSSSSESGTPPPPLPAQPTTRRAGTGVFFGIRIPAMASTKKKEYTSIAPCPPSSSPVRTPCRHQPQRKTRTTQPPPPQFPGFADDDVFQTPAKSSGPEREEDDDEEGEEEPDTSYSRLFESGRWPGSDAEEDTDMSSVASEEQEQEEEVVKNKSKTNRGKKQQGGVAWAEDTDGDADDDDFNSDEDDDDQDRDADFYAPTPMKPPQSVRRSPRSAARIRKSLHSSLLFSTGKPRASGRMQMEAVVVMGNPVKGNGDRKRKRMTLDEAYPEDESEGEAENDVDGSASEKEEEEDEAMQSSASEDSSEDDERLKRPTSSRHSNQPPRKRLRFLSTPERKKKAPRPLKELPSNTQPHLCRRNPATTSTTTTTTMRTSPRKPSRRVSYIEPEASEDELMMNVNHVSATFSAKRMKGRRMRGLVMMRKAK